jgi:hypothetical protein
MVNHLNIRITPLTQWSMILTKDSSQTLKHAREDNSKDYANLATCFCLITMFWFVGLLSGRRLGDSLVNLLFFQ